MSPFLVCFEIIAISAVSAAPALAAPPTAPPAPAALPDAERAHAIDAVLRLLTEGYVLPDVAKRMEQAVRTRQQKGEYARLSGEALAAKLTEDLQAVSKDRHLRVAYSAERLPEEGGAMEPSPEEWERIKRGWAKQNYGLMRAEVLKGNVGLLRFDVFADPSVAGDTYAAGMALVANTDALILDLRGCRGSMSKDAIPFLCGYLFDKPTHLNDFHWRDGAAPDGVRVEESWSRAEVPGRRYADRPVYVLTSGHTFSGGEELAYDLKNLKRATLVGETTGGGANPGGSRRATDHFSVWLPVGRAVNPVTKANWEGVGVAPDVSVPAARALPAAHLAALRKIAAGEKDAAWKGALAAAAAELEREGGD